ncbi:segregation and condensation protein A [Streptomyces sp. NPDC092046]|uniref:segregation and condensation protein A n=1 Tax=Streptomyces sp. NPDC092046 TaxID=3366009 RepID=UPI003829F4A4
MPHPPDETSRPPHRRLLGRGPGSAAPRPSGADEAALTDEPAGPGTPPGVLEAAYGAEGAHGAPYGAERALTGPGGAEEAPAGREGAGSAGGALTELPGPQGAGEAPDAPTAATAALDAPSAAVAAPAGPLAAERTRTESLAADRASGELPGAEAAPPGVPAPADGRFTVRLANFEGPFDLLLQLIAKHRLDVTEVALSKVTDEFMGHIRAMGPDWDLDQTTEFLVVAATLLDLKAARLLPVAEVEDEADLALLEARDLLFARLLQYRAYKRIAEIFAERWESEGRRYPRTVGLEAHHAELLPEVVISIGAEGFAALAVKAMQPKAKPQVYVDHIHAPLVSVREQAGIVVALLRERGVLSFRELAEGAGDTLTVVARFLALLELYREKAVALDQETALGELTVSWTGGEADAAGAVTDEFDQEDREDREDQEHREVRERQEAVS